LASGGEKKLSRVGPVSFGERTAELARLHDTKMARSSHAFVRGSATEFYSWLRQTLLQLPQGPAVWICGDCHLGNLGPVADQSGRVAIEIRDLDQTLVGNPAYDLIRLGLSLASSARGSGLPGRTTIFILQQLAAGYCAAFAGDFEAKEEKPHRSKAIQELLRRSVERRWRDLAFDRLGGDNLRLPKGKKFWTLTTSERRAVEQLVERPAVAELLNEIAGRKTSDAAEILDLAYWVKGCSSLGRLRCAVLLRVPGANSSRLGLLDIKEAAPSIVPGAAGREVPGDDAERVVSGALALSAKLGARMRADKLLGRSVVVR
jgi:uncharacterized protein (DUF2252 family)